MYQNLLVYISRTLMHWHNYSPTQTEPVNRCPRQPGWYQGGKAERSDFADCLIFNRLALCTDNQWQLTLPTYVRKCHGNAQHVRAGSQTDLVQKHPSLQNSSPFAISQQESTSTLISCWLITAMSSHGNSPCSKGNGLTKSWLNAQNCT